MDANTLRALLDEKHQKLMDKLAEIDKGRFLGALLSFLFSR